MNNKGFAISTLIYGLSIMGVMLIAILMGIMSNNRSNTKEISQSIEQELILYGMTEKSFDETSESKSYTVLDESSGWYRVELWGAQGQNGAYGAYTSGIIKLMEGQTLYFNVGKNAGQSSDVRIIGGEYTDLESYSSRIMVAAGGGSGAGAVGGTTVGYSAKSIANGGRVKEDGTFDATASNNNLLGYTNEYQVVKPDDGVSFVSGPVGNNGGGSGYYSSNNPDVGGISYIAGYAGSGNANGGYYFIDGQMFPGVNKGMGKAKITKVLDYDEKSSHTAIRRVNKKLNKVKAIRDCLKVNNGKNNELDVNLDTFSNIIAVKDGNQVDGTFASNLEEVTGGYKCRVYNLGDAVDLDEIAVWHNVAGRDYFNHRIYVKKENLTDWTIIKDDKYERSMTEIASGYHISAYQPDTTEEFPVNGNYYIVPVLDENKAITAIKDSDNPLKLSYIRGDKNQIWSIAKVDDKLKKSDDEYRIIDQAYYHAMEIKESENKVGNTVMAFNDFNNSRRNEPQIWKIESIGDGTFAINSAVKKFNNSIDSGYLAPKKDLSNNTVMIIGSKDLNCQKYKFISLEYNYA